MEKPSHHNVSSDFTLTDVIQSRIASVYFYNNCIAVVEIAEGKNLNVATGSSLLMKGLMILKNRPWVYISNRVNDYSVQLTDYDVLHRIPTLKALGIARHVATETDPLLESMFCRKPFNMFTELEEALRWGEHILNEEMVS